MGESNIKTNEELEYLDEQESCETSEDILNAILVQEELKRIDIQENPKSKVSKEIKDGKTYKESMEVAHVIGSCLHILLGYGIDYNNSLSLAQGIAQNRVELEKFKIQGVQAQNQTV